MENNMSEFKFSKEIKKGEYSKLSRHMMWFYIIVFICLLPFIPVIMKHTWLMVLVILWLLSGFPLMLWEDWHNSPNHD